MKRLLPLVFVFFLLAAVFNYPVAFIGETSAVGSQDVYFKFLVIVPDDQSWISALQPFVDWKSREGLPYFSDFPANCLPVKVTNLTEIQSRYGSVNASSIRSYIMNFWEENSYAAGKSTLKYVLLVGDVAYIPSYLYNVTIKDEEFTYATDQYYADFYYPAVGQYINPAVNKTDWQTEVYVGRFPVNNAQELEKVVNKTVSYEMYANDLNNPAGWEQRMLFLGAITDNGELIDSEPVWHDGAFITELIKQNCSDWWTGASGPIPNPTTLYDTNDNLTIWSTGYDYLNDLHNLTSTNVVEQISTVGFSAVFSMSHGSINTLAGMTAGSPNATNPPFFTILNVSSLKNNYTLPFWFSDACNTGAFQTDLSMSGYRCLGEELLLADPAGCGGVVAYIGSSNASWYKIDCTPPQNRPENLETLSNRLANLTFCQLYYASSPTSYSSAKWGLGAALFEAKRLYNETSWDVPSEMHMATCLGFNLLGDPSLQIWSETPVDTSSAYNISSPAVVSAEAMFAVHVDVATPISGGNYPSQGARQGAKVCLSRVENGEVVWCQVNLTDANGNVTFTAPAQLGVYNLTVTDHPYLVPYLSQVQVVEPHDVAITNVAVSASPVERGVSLVVNVTAENLGSHAETFNVTLYANETLIDAKNVTLLNQESTVIVFSWNTTSCELGNYILKAEASQILNETNIANNTYVASYTVNVIPEFPLWIILPLFMIATLLAMVTKKNVLSDCKK